MAFTGLRTYGTAHKPASAEEDRPLTEEERASILAAAQGLAGGTVARIGDTLSAPGDYWRGFLANMPGQRLTGRDLLRHFGAAGEEDNWGNFFGGLLVDLGTDPLNLVTGPTASVTKAGQALRKLNWADDAASVATRKAIRAGTPAADLPLSARLQRKALEDTGRNVTDIDPAVLGRPWYGRNRAMRDLTLEDFINHADDTAAARKQAIDTLGQAEFNRLRNQPLSRDMGLGLPGYDPFVTFDLPGGRAVGNAWADAKDLLGGQVRWSWPGRVAASLFDNRVDRTVDPEDQLVALAAYKRQQPAVAKASGEAAERISRLFTAEPDAATQGGGDIMRRLIETGGDAADQTWAASHPEAARYVQEWLAVHAPDSLRKSREVGLNSNALADPYGIRYLPRQTHALLERASRTNKQLRSALSTLTGDQLGRSEAMKIPGGTDMLNKLSQDPRFVGKAALPEAQAAAELMNELTPLVGAGQPALEPENMVTLARVLRSLPEGATASMPMFGQHPAEQIGGHLRGRARAAATASTLYDSLATWAVDSPSALAPGGRHVTIPEALKRIGLNSVNETTTGAGAAMRFSGEGASQQMRERLAAILTQKRGVPVSADQINLASLSIPEDAVQRLVRAADFFQTDQAMGEVMKVMDHYTQIWRPSILAWPSKSTRDAYSGQVSNWLSNVWSWPSMRAAYHLTTNGPQDPVFVKWLQAQPRYQGPDGLHLFQRDVASQQLVNGVQRLDPGASTSAVNAMGGLAGVGGNRASITDALREMAPQAGRTWRGAWDDFWTWNSALRPMAETKNPIVRAGAKLTALTDSHNRLTGFMAAIEKGYSPEAAAAIVKRAQTDGSTLSSFERNFLRFVFPWYSYQSRIFRQVVGQLAERPFGGRYGMLLKGSERAQDQGTDPSEEEYIPSALRAQFAGQLPEALGGRPAPGTVRYVTDVDLPGFDQLNMIETPGTLGGMFTGTARQIGMQLHPAMRTATEFMFGQDLFSNRPLGEAVSPLDAITGQDVPAVVDKAVELLPFAARPLYALRSLTDTTGGASLQSRAAKTAVNALTGVKFRDVSPEYRLSDATRQLEKSIEPYTQDFTQTFIPKEMIPYVPDWAQRRMKMARQMSKERKVLRDERKLAAGINPLE